MAKSTIGIKLDRRVLDRLERETPGTVDRVLGELARDVKDYAKEHMSNTAPLPSKPGDPPAVQTGNLKNSIVHDRENARRWTVTVHAEYGAFLEYGTVRMAPRPFLRPALLKIAEAAPKAFKAEVFD